MAKLGGTAGLVLVLLEDEGFFYYPLECSSLLLIYAGFLAMTVRG